MTDAPHQTATHTQIPAPRPRANRGGGGGRKASVPSQNNEQDVTTSHHSTTESINPSSSFDDEDFRSIQQIVNRYLKEEEEGEEKPTPRPSAARPKKKMTETQLANLAKGREKAIASRREKKEAQQRESMSSLLTEAATKAVEQYKAQAKTQEIPVQGRSRTKKRPVQGTLEEEVSERPRRQTKRKARSPPPSRTPHPSPTRYYDDPSLAPRYAGIHQRTADYYSMPPPSVNPRLLRPAF